jgi:hypothetical protein
MLQLAHVTSLGIGDIGKKGREKRESPPLPPLPPLPLLKREVGVINHDMRVDSILKDHSLRIRPLTYLVPHPLTIDISLYVLL